MYEQAEMMQEMANGGYTVTRSNDRKGKTHKVTGPDGTVKYFGDSKLGQHPKDPERKAAFYARHKKNLANNPFFRAFARKTWKEGGSTFSGNAWYQDGGGFMPETMPFPTDYAVEMMRQGGVYSNASMKKNSNFTMQMGGPTEGEVMDVSPEQLEMLRQQGYQFEIM
jgi:hypothetical protein